MPFIGKTHEISIIINFIQLRQRLKNIKTSLTNLSRINIISLLVDSITFHPDIVNSRGIYNDNKLYFGCLFTVKPLKIVSLILLTWQITIYFL